MPELGAHPLRAAHRPGDEPLDGLTLRRGQPRRVPLDEVRERPVVRRVAGLECLDRLVDPAVVRRERRRRIGSSRLSHGSSYPGRQLSGEIPSPAILPSAESVNCTRSGVVPNVAR